MNNDLISRSAAKDEILSWAAVINKPHLLSKDDTLHVLDTLPAVDAVEVVRYGRWEPHPSVHGYERCSVCRECNIWGEWADGKKWNYCPHCGAKMDGEQK